MLNDLAKNMGVLVKDNNFVSFDILKDLEIARNCLYKKQMNQPALPNCVEHAEFIPNEDQMIIAISSGEDSDLEEMLIQKSKEKSKFGKKKKFSFSTG